MHRFKEPATGKWNTRLLPGECYVTAEDEVLLTGLGSCISACIRDPQTGVGGMNHFMLPEESAGAATQGSKGQASIGDAANRYGGYAMESLINELMKLGGARSRLEIKLFGGGKMLASRADIGRRNIEFVREFLRIEGLRAAVEDLGDVHPRKVAYHPKTGKAMVKRLQPLEAKSIVVHENSYRAEVSRQADGGDVELFD